MEKSYVSLDTKVCPICTKKHEVGILLDTRLRNTMEKHTITGYETCPECKTHIENNFVAFVSVDIEKSTRNSNEHLSVEGAYRTGRIAWLKKSVAEQMFGRKINSPMIFASDVLIDDLERLRNEAKMDNGSDDSAVTGS